MEQIIKTIDAFILDVYGPTYLDFEPVNIGIPSDQYPNINDMIGCIYMSNIQHFVSLYHTHMQMYERGKANGFDCEFNQKDSQNMKKIVDLLTNFLNITYGLSVEPIYLGPTEKEFEDDPAIGYKNSENIGMGFRFATSALKSTHQFAATQPQPQPQLQPELA